MIQIELLELDDVIEPDDLIRDVYPILNEFGNAMKESHFKWKPAWAMLPAWVGKTQRDYLKKGRSTAPSGPELQIIRIKGEVPQSFWIDAPKDWEYEMYKRNKGP